MNITLQYNKFFKDVNTSDISVYKKKKMYIYLKVADVNSILYNLQQILKK